MGHGIDGSNFHFVYASPTANGKCDEIKYVFVSIFIYFVGAVDAAIYTIYTRNTRIHKNA